MEALELEEEDRTADEGVSGRLPFVPPSLPSRPAPVELKFMTLWGAAGRAIRGSLASTLGGTLYVSDPDLEGRVVICAGLGGREASPVFA